MSIKLYSMLYISSRHNQKTHCYDIVLITPEDLSLEELQLALRAKCHYELVSLMQQLRGSCSSSESNSLSKTWNLNLTKYTNKYAWITSVSNIKQVQMKHDSQYQFTGDTDCVTRSLILVFKEVPSVNVLFSIFV